MAQWSPETWIRTLAFLKHPSRELLKDNGEYVDVQGSRRRRTGCARRPGCGARHHRRPEATRTRISWQAGDDRRRVPRARGSRLAAYAPPSPARAGEADCTPWIDVRGVIVRGRLGRTEVSVSTSRRDGGRAGVACEGFGREPRPSGARPALVRRGEDFDPLPRSALPEADRALRVWQSTRQRDTARVDDRGGDRRLSTHAAATSPVTARGGE